MCGQNLIILNVRPCHCFFLCGRHMQGQPSGSAKFCFLPLRQPQLFDSISI